MIARIKDSVIDDAINLIFENGLSLSEACRQLTVTKEVVAKRIRARGLIIPKFKAKPIKQLPDSEIISLYKGGMSELAISNKFNVSRNVIRLRLINGGVHIRGQSEANIASAANMTFEQRQDRARAANNALRGTKQCVKGRRKRATNLESIGYENMTGMGEEDLKNMLESRSINFTWQKACDIYSIDFAIGNVAVELKCGPANNVTSDVKRGRIKHLRERGFFTIYVVFKCIESMIQSFDYIISLVDRANSNPPPVGEYWVVRCRLDNFTRVKGEGGKFSSVSSSPKLFNSLGVRKY